MPFTAGTRTAPAMTSLWWRISATRRKTRNLLGFPAAGLWKLRVNSDAAAYSDAFSNVASGEVHAAPGEQDGLACHAALTIGPYSVLVYSQDNQEGVRRRVRAACCLGRMAGGRPAWSLLHGPSRTSHRLGVP